MLDQKEQFRAIIRGALDEFYRQKGKEPPQNMPEVRVENPPKPEMGDLGSPLFLFAKEFRLSPQSIAEGLCSIITENAKSGKALGGQDVATLGTYTAIGPYINVSLNKEVASVDILQTIFEQKAAYGSSVNGKTAPFAGQNVMVEYSSPNTNKPLHLGHLRNDALGESVSRILKKAGAHVFRTNIINNRGVHICKSMLAYKLFHQEKGDTPERLGLKGDHFVGQCYVEFDKWEKEHPEATDEAQKMLVLWENGDKEVRALWNKMNEWTLSGVQETYRRTGVGFEKLYFESDTYLLGKEVIAQGLEKGIFFKAQDGSVRIDVTEVTGPAKDGGAQEKVLLRKDGTSVYITQDIGTAIERHKDWPYTQLVYVVASEQIYHFKVLFYILQKLGFDWAKKLHHLSYGLVNLPSGRMKSREGTVVDADDLLDSLHGDALKAIKERGRENQLENADDVAEKVALAALHYYLLQVSPVKDMLFNPEESLSFSGNTGPYLQYMGARISSILEKAQELGVSADFGKEALSLLVHASEWALIKQLGDFPAIVAKAAETFDPSVVAAYLYELCKTFSAFYRDCPILPLAQENKTLCAARLSLVHCTLIVLKEAMSLVLVPFVEKM